MLYNAIHLCRTECFMSSCYNTSWKWSKCTDWCRLFVGCCHCL